MLSIYPFPLGDTRGFSAVARQGLDTPDRTEKDRGALKLPLAPCR